MPNNQVQAAGGAMPAPKPADTYDKLSDAMIDLETPVSDVMHMARIAADISERLFEHPTSKNDDYFVYKVSRQERDAVLFAINDVERRSRLLKESFLSALYAGSRQ